MQPTADVHDQITDAHLPQAAGLVDHATAFDAAVDVLDAHAAAGDTPIGGFLGAREGSSSRFAGRHDDLDLREHKCQKAQILEPPAACRQGVGGGIGHPLIVGTARRGLTQKEAGERGVDQQYVVHRMVFLLAARTARLLNRILGTPDAPFGAIVANRGEAGRATGADGSVVGTTTAVASASAIPRRLASSVTERVGASPSVHSVARSTTRRT